MNIDLHVHTSQRSGCARSTEDDMIRAAIARGLDGIVITDHECLVPVERLTGLNAKYAPFRIFGGIEMHLCGEDMLVLGVHDFALERGVWTYPQLRDFVEEHGGFLALAHPFRFNGDIQIGVERFPPHALEVRSHNTPRWAESRIRQTATELGLPLLSNSDAHHVSEVGDYYNTLDCVPEDEEDLMAILKAGAFTCVNPP